MQWAAERAVAASRDCDSCLAIAEETSVAHLRWSRNSLTTNGCTHAQRLTVVVVAGDRAGVVAREGDLAPEAITGMVRAAERTARRAEPAPDAQPLTSGESPDWAEPPARTSFGEFGGVIPALADLFERAARFSGYAERQVRTTYAASSTGLRLRHVQPSAILDLTAENRWSSSWTGASAADFAAIDLAAMADQATTRLYRTPRRIPLPAGDYEVLLAPSAAADFMLRFHQSANALEALGGGSAFSAPDGRTRVGERLAGVPVTLYSDPAEPGLECAPFVLALASTAADSVFDNGMPLARTEWIDGGVLSALTQTRYSAGKSGLRYTPKIDNLVLDGGSGTLADLIANTRRGLLVSSVWYLREVDPRSLLLAGLTRDGVQLVENGEIAGPVRDFRFNESPLSLLERLAEAGRTERTLPREWSGYCTRTAMPPLRISDFGVCP
ncbi:metallopeptidase TldD-related protein [Amycolatopsis nivea]